MNNNTFTKTTLIECPRSQSDEGIANNNIDPSKWTNKVGQGLVLKAGDQISVHSSYVSEIGTDSPRPRRFPNPDPNLGAMPYTG